MGLIKIDETRCKKEGFCVSDCSQTIIRLSKETGFPEMIRGGEDACIKCGHCVTVCPEGALTHKVIPLELAPPIADNLVVNEAQAVQFLRSRRSVRLFKKKPVAREKVLRLIEIARHAPTAGNTQTVQWLVHTDRAKMREIATGAAEWLREFVKDPAVAAARPYLPRIVAAWDSGRDSILRDAPVLLVASAPKEAAFGLVDVTIALSYLDLLAPTLGLGTCWAGLLEAALLASPALVQLVGIPEGHPHHYPMMLGYSAVKHHRLAPRKPPRITFA